MRKNKIVAQISRYNFKLRVYGLCKSSEWFLNEIWSARSSLRFPRAKLNENHQMSGKSSYPGIDWRSRARHTYLQVTLNNRANPAHPAPATRPPEPAALRNCRHEPPPTCSIPSAVSAASPNK